MNTYSINKFKCYLIGEDSLADHCIKIILESGHALLGICSPSEQIKHFALQNNIPYTNSLEVLESWLRTNRCDFLFSVVNSRILSKALLQLPRYFAVNYHNAPLPKYAGVHATSWAIINHERYHGITWHVIAEGIDTGDILKQATFKIDKQETNFTLDVKCIEKAIPMFRKLLRELASGKYKRIKQDFNQRSYFNLYQKPKHWGIISWTSAASEIHALFRALSFSEYANKLCLPKFIFNHQIFFPKKVDVLKKEKRLPPGTIVDISDDYLRIATATDDVAFSQLTDINNKSYSIHDFANLHKFKPGILLPTIDENFLNQLKQHSEQLAKNESFWVRVLEKTKNLNFWSFSPEENAAHKKNRTTKFTIYNNRLFKNQISSILLGNADTTDALITVFLLYLYRLNNYDDFSVGYSCEYPEKIPSNMRTFFAETVPLNLSFSPEINFEDAAAKVANLLKLARQNKTFAKDVVLRCPQLAGRSMSFPIVISTTKPAKEFLGKINNVLYFVITKTQIILYSAENLDKINQKILDNIIGHLRTLINELLLHPSSSVKNLSILTKKEKQLIFRDWNNTTRPYPRYLSIPEIFEQQARKYPHNIAVKHGDLFLTYKELNQKANQIGFYLNSLGIKDGGFIATYFDKGINSILGILSVLKAGAAYIPIDPMYPTQHIKYILEDSGINIILTQEKNIKSLEECLPTGKFVLLSIDDTNVNQIIFNGKNKRNLRSVSPTNLAYIMYTSGSTGAPKGVMINHRAIIRLVKGTDYIKFLPSDFVAQAASMSFDASTFEIWGALLNGAKLVCADSSIVSDTEKFADFLRNEKISIMVLVSAVFDHHANINPGMFKNLKCLLVGGDVLNVETINEVVHCPEGSPLRVLNIYGPTENATCTTIFSIPKNFNKNRSIPIGKPIANTTVYILDKYLNPMPIGVPGELCTGGDGLSSGYWHKELLNKEKFIDFNLDGEKSRLYKIGDLVRWLPDGNVDYLCRLDNQVKVRGFRIELEAIEVCLLNSDRVRQCAVVVRQDKKMRKTLVAYLVAKNKDNDNVSFIRQFLEERLPPYMVPNIFIIVDELPLTPNGKVDKKVLLLKFQDKILLSENCVYPHTELQHKIAEIWKKLLNLDVISIEDNFFHLGGYSLLVTELVAKIRKQFNIDFPLHSFLERPTIVNLVKLIESQRKQLTVSDNLNNIPQVFVNDTFLDPNIQPLSPSLSMIKEPKTVLLTGVTGFLGAYLLHDLYHLSNARIHCLIRAGSLDIARGRLKNALNRYNLSEMINTNSNRINIIVGDLAKPLLGLDQITFEMLSEEVDYIYHCGAYVHHIYNYEMLRNENVLSTLEIVKLATNKKTKYIHYVSTLSAVLNYVDNKGLIIEDFFDEDNLSLEGLNGYAQTKLASEIILSKAYKRGIPVFIYRPSWIVGHKDTGVCSIENNHLLLLLKGCIQMGYAPKLETELNLLPVDFVSNFIIQASLNHTKINGRVFNIINTSTIKLRKLFEYINNYGHNVKLVSVAEWQRDHIAKVNIKNVIYPLISLYHADGGLSWARVQNKFLSIYTENTKSASKTLNLNYTKIDDIFLKCLFDFLHQSGFIASD